MYVYEHAEGDRYGNRMTPETADLSVTLDRPGWNLYAAGEIDKHPNGYFNDIEVSAHAVESDLWVSQIVIESQGVQ